MPANVGGHIWKHTNSVSHIIKVLEWFTECSFAECSYFKKIWNAFLLIYYYLCNNSLISNHETVLLEKFSQDNSLVTKLKKDMCICNLSRIEMQCADRIFPGLWNILNWGIKRPWWPRLLTWVIHFCKYTALSSVQYFTMTPQSW